MYFCGALIYEMYDNWQQRVVIVSFADDVTPVWDIPFPAITICPTIKIQQEFKLYKYFQYITNNPEPPFNLTDEEYKFQGGFSKI